jgi:transcriptional regulator with XRE-family HTH domain
MTEKEPRYMENESLKVGRRMRALREQSGLSLRALAEACDLSVNAISMIERGESSPRVSSLHLLAQALNVRITDFFESEEQRSIVLVRKHERPLTQGEDVAIESVGTGLRNQQVEPFVVTIEPGGSAGEETMKHPGQEFIYCLEGEVEYLVAGDSYVLAAGDTLLFEATEPHTFRNSSDSPAKLLLVLQASEGGGIGRERHLRM